MPASLLDLLNGAELPSNWSGTDREILGAYVSALRRRTERVEPTRHVRVVVKDNGQSSVVVDGAVLQTSSTSRVLVEKREVSLVLGETGSWPVLRRINDPVEFLPKASKYGRGGAAAAHRVAEDLRAHPALLDWPSDQYASELSAAGLGELENWRLEWLALQASSLRRCGQPSCAAPGGRLFKARRSQRDCDECRQAPCASKPTRWRHRQRTGE